METLTLIDAIETEGNRLADAADRAGLDAKVPSCPRWRVRDLVRHTGGVHRWAGGHLRSPQKDLINSGPLASQFGGWPDDAVLIGWYRDEVDLLVRSLREAPDDIETATFLPAQTAKHFWARRQCHEVTVHRIDAELAAGTVTPVDAAQAADGIDELLSGFVSRNTGKLRSDAPMAMVIAPDDVPDRWTVVISEERPAVTRDVDLDAGLTVSGPADVIFRCLWNRAEIDEVSRSGDDTALSLFKERIKIRWS